MNRFFFYLKRENLGTIVNRSPNRNTLVPLFPKSMIIIITSSVHSSYSIFRKGNKHIYPDTDVHNYSHDNNINVKLQPIIEGDFTTFESNTLKLFISIKSLHKRVYKIYNPNNKYPIIECHYCVQKCIEDDLRRAIKALNGRSYKLSKPCNRCSELKGFIEFKDEDSRSRCSRYRRLLPPYELKAMVEGEK